MIIDVVADMSGDQDDVRWEAFVTAMLRLRRQARPAQPSRRAWTLQNPATWALRCCCRSGEADVQGEMSEPQIQDCATGPVHDVRQQDDGEDDNHQPEEEHNDYGDRVPGYGSRSSHGPQLPGAARLIRNRR